MPTFNAEAVQLIRRAVRQVLAEEIGSLTRNLSGSRRLARWVAKADGSGVTARSGTTPGTGTVTLQTLSSGALADQTGESGAAVTVSVKSILSSPIAANAYCFVEQDQLSGAYWVDDTADVADTVIARCDSGQAMLPGVTTGKTFSKYTWNGSTLTDTLANITVKDPLNCNCYLPSEYGLFQVHGGDYIPVGSHGLVRFANADSTIGVDGSGAGKFWENKSLGTAVTISNTYEGYKRALVAAFSDDCVVVYDTTQSLWIALPPWAAMFARGKANGSIPSGGTEPPIDNWLLWDMKAPDAGNESAPGSGAWDNDYGIAGPDDTDILFVRSIDASKGNWVGIQCDLQTMVHAKDLRMDSSSPYAIQNQYDTFYGYRESSGASWTTEISTEAC